MKENPNNKLSGIPIKLIGEQLRDLNANVSARQQNANNYSANPDDRTSQDGVEIARVESKASKIMFVQSLGATLEQYKNGKELKRLVDLAFEKHTAIEDIKNNPLITEYDRKSFLKAYTEYFEKYKSEIVKLLEDLNK